VRPKLIVELAGDDLTKSPIHTSGYALRFPRLVKFRDDKGVGEATTLTEIKTLFKLQKKI
jgi:DNA ligase-1